MGQCVLLDSGNALCKPGNIQGNRIRAYLLANGHRMADSAEEADTILLSLCMVTGEAEARAGAILQRYAERAPRARLLTVGCAGGNCSVPLGNGGRWEHYSNPAALDGVFGADPPYAAIDLSVISQDEVGTLFASCRDTARPRRLAALRDGLWDRLLRSALPADARLRRVYEETTRRRKLYVEIGRGCVSNCAYCVMTRLRHHVRSRPREAVLDDIRRHLQPGLRLSLVGDDCGCYGMDGSDSLPGLVRAIAAEHPGLEIELAFIHPRWLVEQIDAYEALFRAVPISSVCVAMQSGSDAVLERMNRHYRAAEALQAVARLRAASPRTIIWTHIIVGFAGETRRDFLQSAALLPAFDNWYIYVYSEREGTAGYTLPDRVPPAVRRLRALELRARAAARTLRHFAAAAWRRSPRAAAGDRA